VRLYSVAIVSLTIGAPVKWTDNLLSQHDVEDVVHRDRGVARGVSWNALVTIALIRALNQELGCGVRESVALASALGDGSRTLQKGGYLTLGFDRQALEASLRDRLREVIESAPRPRRGRPPRRVARRD
jgi:hypothetical protein